MASLGNVARVVVKSFAKIIPMSWSIMMPSKINCHKCIHLKPLGATDSHYRCDHPYVWAHGVSKSIKAMIALQKDEYIRGPVEDLRIVGNKHGIEQGWFFWPLCFDPTWLVSCKGYTP